MIPLPLLASSRNRNNEVWLDPSDLTTLWQDAGGTTQVSAVGQTVAKIDDKSGNGNHAYPTAAVLAETSSGYKYIKYTGATGALGLVLHRRFSRNSVMMICPPERIGTQAMRLVPVGDTATINMNHGQIVIRSRNHSDSELDSMSDSGNSPETFAYWPSVQDVTDATSLWTQTATATATSGLMGATLSGSYRGGVQAPNGFIYFVPYSATDILVIDPTNGTAEAKDYGLDLSGSNKWIGAVLGGDGKIYCIPYDSTSILIIDTNSDTASLSAMGATLTGSAKWVGGVLGTNGKIYGIPSDSTDILIINVGAGTASRSAMTATLTGTSKWFGGVLGTDGKIYGIPRTDTNILIINTGSGTASKSAMTATLTGVDKWRGGVLGQDGKIYGVPFDSTDILIINTDAGTASRSAMGATLSDADKWIFGALGLDGRIYCCPADSTDFLIINTGAGTASRSNLGVTTTGNFAGLVQSAHGKMYGTPLTATDILQVRTYGTGGGLACVMSPYLNKS